MDKEKRIAELEAELASLKRSLFKDKIKGITDLIEKAARSIDDDDERNVNNIKFLLNGKEGSIDIASFLDNKGFIQFRHKRGRCWKLPK